jgi:hypothetical protein
MLIFKRFSCVGFVAAGVGAAAFAAMLVLWPDPGPKRQ